MLKSTIFTSRFFLLGICFASITALSAETLKEKPTSITSYKRELVQSNNLHTINDILNGSSEEISYIENFPYEHYQLIQIPSYWSFYIDPINDIIKNDLRAGGHWDIETEQMIKKYAKANTTVVDIGAHIGTQTLTLSQIVGANGKVIAFEPQLKIYRELVMNLHLNKVTNVTAYRNAVGDKNGIIQMASGNPGNEGGTGLGEGGDYTFIIPLDSLELKNISLIKIDVENYEIPLLEGARKTIAENKPVMLIEIMGNPSPDRNQKVKDTISLIEGMGYEVTQYKACDYLALPK